MQFGNFSDSFASLADKLPDAVTSPIDLVRQQVHQSSLLPPQGELKERARLATIRLFILQLIDHQLIGQSAKLMLTSTQLKRLKALYSRLQENLQKCNTYESIYATARKRLQQLRKQAKKGYLPAVDDKKHKRIKQKTGDMIVERVRKWSKQIDTVEAVGPTELYRALLPDLPDFPADKAKQQLRKAASKYTDQKISHAYDIQSCQRTLHHKATELANVSEKLATWSKESDVTKSSLQDQQRTIKQEMRELIDQIYDHLTTLEQIADKHTQARDDYQQQFTTRRTSREKVLTNQHKQTRKQHKDYTKQANTVHGKRTQACKQVKAIYEAISSLTEKEVVGSFDLKERIEQEISSYQTQQQLADRIYGYISLAYHTWCKDHALQEHILTGRIAYLHDSVLLQKEANITRQLLNRINRKQIRKAKATWTKMVEINAAGSTGLVRITQRIEQLYSDLQERHDRQTEAVRKGKSTVEKRTAYIDQLQASKQLVITGKKRLTTHFTKQLYAYEVARLTILTRWIERIQKAAKKAIKAISETHKKAELRLDEAQQSVSLKATEQNKQQLTTAQARLEAVEGLEESLTHTQAYHKELLKDLNYLQDLYTVKQRAAAKELKQRTIDYKKQVTLTDKQDFHSPLHLIDPDEWEELFPRN